MDDTHGKPFSQQEDLEENESSCKISETKQSLENDLSKKEDSVPKIKCDLKEQKKEDEDRQKTCDLKPKETKKVLNEASLGLPASAIDDQNGDKQDDS